MNRRLPTILAIVALAGAAVYGTGCGSGASHTTTPETAASGKAATATGSAVFTVVWPPRKATSRLIPLLSNSIRVDVSNGASVVASQTLSRPYASPTPNAGGAATPETGTLTFPGLPVGTYTVTATAFPNADGSGTAQATASLPTTVTQGATTEFALTMTSTIDHIQLIASDPAVTLPATVTVGQKLPLVASAVDASGATVLANLTWTATDPATNATAAAASVDASGVVTALAAGAATITAADSESGKSASTVVTVAAPTPTPTATPAPITYPIAGVPYVPTGGTETLTAVFTTADAGVSTNTYSGYVLLTVSGVGQSGGTQYNDAFYVYTDAVGNPITPADYGYYQLAYAGYTLSPFDAGNTARGLVVGGVPAYSDAHVYTFVLNTSLAAPGKLHFGVADGNFGDNTGAYTIQITQLTKKP